MRLDGTIKGGSGLTMEEDLDEIADGEPVRSERHKGKLCLRVAFVIQLATSEVRPCS